MKFEEFNILYLFSSYQTLTLLRIKMSQKTKQLSLHEDWTVVLLGFLIIGISLFVFLPEVPVFKWSKGSDLLKDVLAIGNMQVLLVQFIYLLIIGSIAAFLIGKSVKNFLLGFLL